MKGRIEKTIEYVRARPILNFTVAVGAVVLPLIVGVIFFAAIEKYTTGTPRFCMSCHARQGNIDFLASSTRHPKSVTCPECHADHTALIPRDFKADAARVSTNCRRCHPEVLQREPQYSNNPLKIIMNHQFHLEGVGAQCTDCHRNISHDKLTPVTNRPRMEFCFQCHEANRETCSTCHTKGHLRPPRQAVARRSVCSKCHPRFEDKQIQIYGIEFSHRRHLAKAIDCNKCHSNVEKHGTIVRDRSECLECHHNRPLSECRRCHSLQRSFYSGRLRQFGFDRFEPNPMFGKVDCDGCHDLKGDHSVKAVSGRCVACHEEGYAELLKVQRTDIEGKLKAILADIGKLERRLGKGRRKDRRLREVESLLAGARKRVELVRKAGALHNPALATEILQQASRQVRRAQARF